MKKGGEPLGKDGDKRHGSSHMRYMSVGRSRPDSSVNGHGPRSVSMMIRREEIEKNGKPK